MGDAAPSLLTFAPMIDSEFSRLVLAYHHVAYRERDHLFGWASLLTLLHGGYGRIPLLHGHGLALTGPRKIAAHFDALVAEDQRLLPTEQPLASQVLADVDRYNGQLAIDVASYAYFHLLPHRPLMESLFAGPVPPGEARFMHRLYPPTRGLFAMLLRLNPKRADDALVRIRTLFEHTDRIFSDGRRTLTGDRLTLGDLALLASTAPLLLPEGYKVMPAPEKMPEPLQRLRAELGGGPTASYVRRLYLARPGGQVPGMTCPCPRKRRH